MAQGAQDAARRPKPPQGCSSHTNACKEGERGRDWRSWRHASSAPSKLVASGPTVSSWHLGSCGQIRRNDTTFEVREKGSVRYAPGATPVCRICALGTEPRVLRPHAQARITGCSLQLESREFLGVFLFPEIISVLNFSHLMGTG